jgi:RNA polymerase sigma factor (sigma-70 family)
MFTVTFFELRASSFCMDNEKHIYIEISSFRDKLYRYSLKLLSDTMEAEDIIQDLYVKIWGSREKFYSVENKEAWCMTVVRNMCIDKIRKRKKQSTYADISDYHFIADHTPTPEKALHSKNSMNMIHQLMEQLSPEQREVIHLRDIEGHSYKEISEITGHDESNVKIYIFRGRQNLRRLISTTGLNAAI